LSRAFESAADDEKRQRLALEQTKGGVEKSRERGEKAAAKLGELEKQRSSSDSRLRTLRELESSMAGFFHGVRAVMEGWRKGNRDCADIEGLVADLITAKGDVAIAIETALGASQQNIITNTAFGAVTGVNRVNQVSAMLQPGVNEPADMTTEVKAGHPGGSNPELFDGKGQFIAAATHIFLLFVAVHD